MLTRLINTFTLIRSKMRANLTAIVEKITFGIIVLTAALIPLLFTSFTTEFFEIPKIAFLAISTMILALLWSFSWVLKGKVIITRTPLDIPLLLLALTVLISTATSDTKYVSIFGNFPRVHGSAIAWITYILLYFVAVSNIKSLIQARIIVFTLIASSVLNSVVALLSYSGAYLPLGFAKNMIFNPAGAAFSAVALCLMLLPIIFVHILRPSKILGIPLSLIASIIFGLVIVLLGNLTSMLIALVIVTIIILLTDKKYLKESLPFLVAPILVALLIFGLGFIPAKNNPLQAKRGAYIKDFQELQLSPTDSWKVAISSFRDRPAFGSGPSTFLFNFTQYKPATINMTPLWNLRFDSGYNEFFQILTTLGVLGFLAFVFAVLMLFKVGAKVIKSEDSFVFGLGLSIFVIIALLAVHVSTPVTMVASILITAALFAIKKSEGKVEEFTLGIKTAKIGSSDSQLNNLVTGDILPIILFIPIVIMVLVGSWQAYTIILADVNHRLGLNAISQNEKGLQAYEYLAKARNTNPYIDLYRTDMAQTNFLIANAIATAKAPNEASPGGSLTDQDKQNIQQFLSQSINESRAAVTISPRSAQNWEILASIYRQITGVAESALQFSLDGYGRAIALDPYNPLLRLNVGAANVKSE